MDPRVWSDLKNQDTYPTFKEIIRIRSKSIKFFLLKIKILKNRSKLADLNQIPSLFTITTPFTQHFSIFLYKVDESLVVDSHVTPKVKSHNNSVEEKSENNVANSWSFFFFPFCFKRQRI